MSSPPIHRRRPQHSDDALLSAATAVFAREGFAAATVNQIAERAGTTKPTLYARFGSKAALYEAAVAYEGDAVRTHLFTAYDQASDLPVEEFIREAVNAWFAFAKARPYGTDLLFGDHAGVQSPLPDQTTEAIIQRIAQVVEHFSTPAHQLPGPAAPLIAAMIVGTAINAIRRCLTDPTLDPEATAALTTSFLTAAINGIDPAVVSTINETAPG